MKVKILFVLYLSVVVSLFFYSYTQVDLGLTLSTNSFLFSIQRAFQYIGYFQRPLSTDFFISILFFLFLFYLLFLKLAEKKLLTKKQVWTLIFVTSFILTFSYNAFSYDLFNYIFYGKIVVYYHQNPYLYKPLDYPKDPMLSFMHWTHATYPYGPVWLGFVIPLFFIGVKFLSTFFLFKIFITSAFLGTSYFIGKILQKIKPQDEIFSLVFFSFNPLVLIESLVSSHNDIWMVFLAILSLYLLISKKRALSFLTLLLSIGIKFGTVFLVPLWIVIAFFQKKGKSMDWDKLFLIGFSPIIVAILLSSNRTNFQPWYFLYILPYAAFLSKKYYVLIPSVILSLTGLLMYVPFLYTGNWNPPIPMLLSVFILVGLGLSIVGVLGFKMVKYAHA
jgi:hypothetical protein